MSDSKNPTRRGFGAMAATALAGVIAATAGVKPAAAKDKLSAGEQTKCGTCEFWGGVRQISADRQSVEADGTGWCNNPKSPAYNKRTKPTQGAPTWQRWGAFDA